MMPKKDRKSGKARLSKSGDPTHALIGASPVEIGRFTYGHDLMTVKEWGEGATLKIGAFCSLAEGLVILLGGNHRVEWATTFPFGHIFQAALGGEDIVGHPSTKGDVIIGNDVWIGRNTTILFGVTVGDGAVISANSTVVKDVGPYEVWGGNPATKFKDRFSKEISEKLLEMQWWHWDTKAIKAAAPLLSRTPDLDILESALQLSKNLDRA